MVLGFLPRSTVSSAVDDNMRYLSPGYRGQSHFIMHGFTIIQYVRSARAYNIPSILPVFERTISCKLIVRSHLWSYPLSHYQQQYRGDELRKSGYFCTLFCSPGSKCRTAVLNSVAPPLLILLFLRERMSRRSTQCTRFATKIKDEYQKYGGKYLEWLKTTIVL